MKLFKKMRKGFTLIELVVVIAVIAILSAISVVSYISITNRAKESNDHMVIDQINTSLLSSQILEKKATVHEIVERFDEEEGYDVRTIKPELKNARFVYSYEKGKFGYWKDNKVAYPADLAEIDFTDSNDLWFFEDVAQANYDDSYSHYLESSNIPAVTAKGGIDLGDCKSISSVTFKRTNSDGKAKKDVVIRTNSFASTLTIDAKLDTVKHYGNAAIVNVEAIAGASYHENGTVGRLIVEEGHAVVEKDSVVFCFVDAGAGSTATAEVKSGASVYDASGNNSGQAAVLESTHDDCGAGHHNYGSQLVIDNYIYEVCKSCGYTLITVQDESGNEVKQTKNVLDSEGNVVSQNITPIETYLVSEPVNTNPSAGTVKNYEISGDPIVETPKVEEDMKQSTCEHSFDDGVITKAPTCTSTGLKTYSCSKCHETYSITVAKAAHKYYDNIGNVHTPDEECTVCHQKRSASPVAKIGNETFASLEAAIESLEANSTATIVLLQDDAAYLTKGSYTRYASWHVGNGKNLTIDLAGYTLKNLIYFEGVSNPSTAYNNGVFAVEPGASLTIKDSSCSYGSTTDGTGKVINELASSVTATYWPTVNRSDNVILNLGSFTLQSGTLESRATGYISFVVDNVYPTNSDIVANIHGGSIINNNGEAHSIRIWSSQTATGPKVTVNITNGYFYNSWKSAIWTHYGHLSTTFVNISNGTFICGCTDGSRNVFDFAGVTTTNITGGTYIENGVDVSSNYIN